MGCIVGEKMEIKLIGETETELICISSIFRNNCISIVGNRYEIKGYNYAQMFKKILDEINERGEEDEDYTRSNDEKLNIINNSIDVCFYSNGKYHKLNSAGQISMPKLDDITLAEDISKEDYEFIISVWKNYHLKLINDVPKDTLERLCKIFNVDKPLPYNSTILLWNKLYIPR